MKIPPFISEFFVLEAMTVSKETYTIAVGTDRQEMIDFVMQCSEKYADFFIGYRLTQQGNVLTYIDDFGKKPTHPASEVRN